jgi:hypothetical protein
VAEFVLYMMTLIAVLIGIKQVYKRPNFNSNLFVI